MTAHSSGRFGPILLSLLADYRGFSAARVLTYTASLLLALTIARSAEPSLAERDGVALAKELQSLRPIEGDGVLRLRNPDGKWFAAIRVRLRFVEQGDSWQSTYEAFTPEGGLAEALVVAGAPGRPNTYQHTVQPAAPSAPRTGAEANVPFVGSEFWLTDLGLEFLHWPEQRITKHEMRKGRSCRVLESVNPNPGNGYARVLSWVDVEHRSVLRAEAYDAGRNLVKEFSIGSFKKIADAAGEKRWQLKTMEIRNERSDSRTRLEFDLELRE
jgi:hypothetical protein